MPVVTSKRCTTPVCLLNFLVISVRFGHQDGVLGIASLFRERAVTCGARDMTVRLWKVPEESQLVFTSSPTSLDCVAMIDERRFVTGAENGLAMMNCAYA